MYFYSEDEEFMKDGWLLNIDGSRDIDLYHDTQYIHDYCKASEANCDGLSSYNLKQFDIAENTLSGSIYLNDQQWCCNTPSQTFLVRRNGLFEFTNIEINGVSPKVKAESEGSHLDLNTGHVTLKWNTQPGPHTVIFSYEYYWTNRNAIKIKKLEKIRQELNWQELL